MKKINEKVPNLKPWKGCEHNGSRKLYFQRGGKWITTPYSYCEDCGALVKKEKIKNE